MDLNEDWIIERDVVLECIKDQRSVLDNRLMFTAGKQYTAIKGVVYFWPELEDDIDKYIYRIYDNYGHMFDMQDSFIFDYFKLVKAGIRDEEVINKYFEYKERCKQMNKEMKKPISEFKTGDYLVDRNGKVFIHDGTLNADGYGCLLSYEDGELKHSTGYTNWQKDCVPRKATLEEIKDFIDDIHYKENIRMR